MSCITKILINFGTEMQFDHKKMTLDNSFLFCFVFDRGEDHVDEDTENKECPPPTIPSTDRTTNQCSKEDQATYPCTFTVLQKVKQGSDSKSKMVYINISLFFYRDLSTGMNISLIKKRDEQECQIDILSHHLVSSSFSVAMVTHLMMLSSLHHVVLGLIISITNIL